MAAVLHSGLVGLDANELGALRLTGDGSLWSVMPLYAEQAQDERLLQFIAHIERWRTLSRRHGVADLLRRRHAKWPRAARQCDGPL